MKFPFVALAIMLSTYIVSAQKNVALAEKAKYIVFEDNFKEDTLGKFPQKWEQFKNVYAAKAYIKGNTVAKELHMEKQVFIRPLIEPLTNIGDGLRIEMDYKPDSTNSDFSITLFNENNAKEGNYLYLFNDNIYLQLYKGDFKKRERFARPIETQKWHKAIYTLKKGLLSLCIDTSCYYMYNDSVTIPGVSIITFGFNGSFSIKNVKISTTNNTRDFSHLNSEKKIVTHAINFDKNKYSITPSSNAYIKDLAAWMKANPTTELEIDGHTDNDGVKELNATLSLSRANEVKRALVANGIEASRLTTKGYGSEKLIDSTNTPVAKSLNRRVEFIKIK